jgi:2-phospho-L-lactate guanylyltransferase
VTPRIIIPVRPLEEGKSRLVASLSTTERHELNQHFFNHVLQVCIQAIPPDHCFVISRSPEVRAQAKAAGTQTIAESGATLNDALAQASAAIAAQGTGPVLAISTDLPLLCADDVRAMLAAAVHADVVIAPDTAETGTNALLLSRPGIIPYRYGKGSFSAHRAAAEAAGLSSAIVRRPGLASDVDTPADLAVIGYGNE